MGTIAHDALFQSCQRLLRLAREGKIQATVEATPEVERLLADAQAAVELAGGIRHPAPQPVIAYPVHDANVIVAKPYDRRKEV